MNVLSKSLVYCDGYRGGRGVSETGSVVSDETHLTGLQSVKALSESQLGDNIGRHIRPPLEDVSRAFVLMCRPAHPSDCQLCLLFQHLLPLLYTALGERLCEQLAPRRVGLRVTLCKETGFRGSFAGDAGVPGGFGEARAYLVDLFDGCRVVDGDFIRSDAYDRAWRYSVSDGTGSYTRSSP